VIDFLRAAHHTELYGTGASMICIGVYRFIGVERTDQHFARTAPGRQVSRLHLVWLLATEELDATTLAERTGATIAAASQRGWRSCVRLASSVPGKTGDDSFTGFDDRHILGVIEQLFSHIAAQGTLAAGPSPIRPPRRERFSARV
jgi:hypothetical protein